MWGGGKSSPPTTHAADDAGVAAAAAARVACVALASLFAATMLAFTLLRVAGLRRVLVPRSGVIGVGVAWTIVSMCLAHAYAPDPTQLAPCTPWHALVVNVPQQAVFLLSLHRRGLVTSAGALRLLLAFVVGVGCLTLAQSISRTGVDGGEDEIAPGAVKSDGAAEEVNVTEAAVDGLIALARAAAGFLLIAGAGERYVDGSGGGAEAEAEGGGGKAGGGKGEAVAAAAAAGAASGAAGGAAGAGKQKTLSSPHELLLAVCWCVMLMLMAIPRFGGETPFADPLGGSSNLVVAGEETRADNGGGGRRMVAWYALRCAAYLLAQWGGLLVVKLTPMRYYEAEEAVGAETKKSK